MSLSPRSLLDSTLHGSIDSILKNLKTCSRRLQGAWIACQDELQILERIYYKGKNQHRSAIFWRHVSEMRRYGGRLLGTDIGRTVERLRYTFFGQNDILDAKSTKGSWTHFPSENYTQDVAHATSACLALVNKMRIRLAQAYRIFNMSMQSGAFVQLLVILIAICSKIDMLLSELQEIFDLCLTVYQNLIRTVQPGLVGKSTPSIFQPTPQDTSPNLEPAPVINETDTMIVDDDIGSSVQRISTQTFSTVVIETKPSVSPVVPDRKSLQLENPHSSNFRTKTCSLAEKTTIQKQKPRKRDEIDDIFGF